MDSRVAISVALPKPKTLPVSPETLMTGVDTPGDKLRFKKSMKMIKAYDDEFLTSNNMLFDQLKTSSSDSC